MYYSHVLLGYLDCIGDFDNSMDIALGRHMRYHHQLDQEHRHNQLGILLKHMVGGG